MTLTKIGDQYINKAAISRILNHTDPLYSSKDIVVIEFTNGKELWMDRTLTMEEVIRALEAPIAIIYL